MENQDIRNLGALERQSFARQYLADSRVQALKSLASMLVNELEILESLTHRENEATDTREISLQDKIGTFEFEMIRAALVQTKGHQRRAARLLGIKGTTLHAKMKRLGIDSRDFGFGVIDTDSSITEIQ